jgi:flagellar motor switch protein FliM
MNSNSDLLSPDEMSALLPETPANNDKDSARKRRAVPYNFRRPDRLSKEQVSSLYLLHDLFAHNLSSSLPLFLRSVSEANLISVEQQSYGDYIRGLSDPTTIFTVAANSLRGVFIVEINASIAFPVIDRMLGGEGQGLNEPRGATDLELMVLEGFVGVIAENYREAWKAYVEFETEIIGRETRPQLLQIVSPNEIVATVVYQIQIGESTGMMSICLPVAMLESVIDKFTRSSYSSGEPTAPEATNSLLKTLSTIRFPIECELEKILVSVSELMALSVGHILRTNHNVERPMNISIADSVKFVGKLAALDNKVVVRISETREKSGVSAGA